MPIKIKERSLFEPGSLIKTRKAIYSADPQIRLAEGTAGVILQGPTPTYNSHCQVQFVGLADPWWVNFSEIEPCIS